MVDSMRTSGLTSSTDQNLAAQKRSEILQKHNSESNIEAIMEDCEDLGDLMRSIHDTDVGKSKQVYMRWDKINFYAPVKA